MFSNYYQKTSLRNHLTVKDTEECVLVYPTSEGTGLILFDMILTYDANNIMVNHTININSIQVSSYSLEKVLLQDIKRTHNILLISDIRTAKRIEKLFDGRLLSKQKLVPVAPRPEWFSPENNKLVAMLGDISTNTTSSNKLDVLLQDEYPCRISTQEKQKIRAYLRARGVQWRTLVALANALPFFISRLRNKGVNAKILSKKFHWG